ncbi:MAG: hypothetical protein ABIR46_00525 [Candidatus Saccharimonadales bacterium]
MAIVNHKNCKDCQENKLKAVALIAVPIERGDIPYDFSLEQIEAAYATTAHILVHLATPLLRSNNDPHEVVEGIDFLTAAGYFRTLTRALLRRNDVSETMRSLLQFNEVAIGFVCERIMEGTNH